MDRFLGVPVEPIEAGAEAGCLVYTHISEVLPNRGVVELIGLGQQPQSG